MAGSGDTPLAKRSRCRCPEPALGVAPGPSSLRAASAAGVSMTYKDPIANARAAGASLDWIWSP